MVAAFEPALFAAYMVDAALARPNSVSATGATWSEVQVSLAPRSAFGETGSTMINEHPGALARTYDDKSTTAAPERRVIDAQGIIENRILFQVRPLAFVAFVAVVGCGGSSNGHGSDGGSPSQCNETATQLCQKAASCSTGHDGGVTVFIISAVDGGLNSSGFTVNGDESHCDNFLHLTCLTFLEVELAFVGRS